MVSPFKVHPVCLNGAKKMAEKVTVIVPVFNEAAALPSVLKPLVSWRNQDKAGRALVVVNDGSIDRTAEVARSLGVKVIPSDSKQGRNIGKAEAFIAGAKQARANKSDVLVTLDADLLNVTPKKVNQLVEQLSRLNVNMVTGKVYPTAKRGFFPKLLRGLNLAFWSKPILKEHSGQRAIKMRALSQLFNNNPKWLSALRGYGLEAGLNSLIKKAAFFPRGGKVLFNSQPSFRKGKKGLKRQVTQTYVLFDEWDAKARELRRQRKRARRGRR